MKTFLFSFILLATFSLAHAEELKPRLDASKLTEVPNAVQLEEELIAGGVPSNQGLTQAAEQGIRTIIDVRDPSEGAEEEKGNAEAVGLRYVNIPITLDNFSEAQAKQLDEVLKDENTGPALLHCASGQRAVAVWALHQNRHEGKSAEDAMKAAKEKGLTKPELEQKLQTLLQS
jgi:uncharacterized protein (TIGR01244 family)